MSTIIIIGAGALGGALAHNLASRDRVAEIKLIDELGAVAAGKALDIQQAGPVEGFRVLVTGGSDPAAVVGASAVVLAGPASRPDDDSTDDEGLQWLQQVTELNRRAAIVCAGASHRRLIERGVRELGIDRRRLLGSAPAALASAIRAIVALELRWSPADVQLTVSGIPPAQIVVGWSEATAGGRMLARNAGPNALARLRERIPRLWPPGSYTLASAAARIAEAVVAGGSARTFSCFVALDGEWAIRQRTAAVPVTIGPFGIEQILEPSLSAHERVQLETALQDG